MIMFNGYIHNHNIYCHLIYNTIDYWLQMLLVVYRFTLIQFEAVSVGSGQGRGLWLVQEGGGGGGGNYN